MKDREEIIKHLCFVYTWAKVNPKYGMGLNIEQCMDAAEWIDDAINLLRETEPRVMTLEELQKAANGEDEIVFIEENGAGYTGWAEPDTDCSGNIIIWWPGNEWEWELDTDEYGRTWRCWTAKPTREQREAVAWKS